MTAGMCVCIVPMGSVSCLRPTVAVAQLVRAPGCGPGGRGFESPLRQTCAVAGHPGHLSRDIVDTLGRLALIDLPRVDTEPPEELALD